jgi:hypothetical protein
MLENYGSDGSFNNFKELFVMFGYSVMFSVAFPVAPLLAWVSTYFEIRVDSWFLLQKARRVIPAGISIFLFYDVMLK